MRVVVYGAGAVGGVIGGCLHRAGHPTVLIVRGAHLAAVQDRGLTLELPGETAVLDVPAVAEPAQLSWDEPTAVLLAMKSQDTERALAALSAVAPPGTAVVCAQNGVENERRAARSFPHVYGMCVMCAATYLEPGVVQAHWTPIPGLLDVGRYPTGADDTIEELARALRDASFDVRVLADVMRWKYRKLLLNLGNAADALFGPGDRGADVVALARQEGEAVLRAAGVDAATAEEDAERRQVLAGMRPTAAGPRRGSSTWQSVARGTGSVEADFLNGEIALLGRLHGIATPVNVLLQRRVAELARRGGQPGTEDPGELLAALGPG